MCVCVVRPASPHNALHCIVLHNALHCILVVEVLLNRCNAEHCGAKQDVRDRQMDTNTHAAASQLPSVGLRAFDLSIPMHPSEPSGGKIICSDAA